MPNQVDSAPYIPPTQDGLIPVLVGRSNRPTKKARTDNGTNNTIPPIDKTKVRDFEVESNVGGEERTIFGCRGPFKIYTPVLETHYQMVDIDTFYSKCFVIVDVIDKENNYQNIGLAKRVITLIPKKQWSNKFIDYSSNANQSSSIVDDSVTDYDLMFFER